MRKPLFSLLVCLFAYSFAFAQAGFNIFGDTIPACTITPKLDSTLKNCATTPPFEAYVEQSCFAQVDRLTARSINMARLSELIRVANCESPNLNYNVTKYVENIKMLVDMRASLILTAAVRWGNDVWLANYDNFCGFPKSIRQTVVDINAAFDCAGIRRPIIQGTVYEHVDGGGYPGINYVKIPPAVIEWFQDDPDIFNPTLQEYYFDFNGNPRTDKFFNFSNIVIPGTETPDVLRLEARMWMFYEAAFVIDAGYTSIHMGDITQWGQNDYNDDGEYNLTWGLLEKIRQYANSRGTFVLLNSEANPGRNMAVTIAGQQHLLFDFNTIPFHFRELTSPPTGGDPCMDGLQSTCNDDYLQEDVDFFNTFPCNAATLPAIVDECVLNYYKNLTGGLAPNPYNQNTNAPHCYYAPGEVPFTMTFDLGNGMDAWAPNSTDSLMHCGENGSTYGYDDTNWFALLPDDCKVAFFKHYMCRVRELTNGHASFVIPGLIIVPDFIMLGTDTINELWQLVDHNLVKKGIQDFVTPSTDVPQIDSSSHCTTLLERSDRCNGEYAPRKGFRVFQKTYEFSVSNDDCLSIYTWHIIDPNGNWLPYFLKGSKVSLEAPMVGDYKIYLRQDNMALNDTGSVEYGPFEYYLEPYCCRNIYNTPPHFIYSCDSSSNEKDYYNFDLKIPSDETYESIVIENTNNNAGQISIDYATNTISGKFESIIDPMTEKDTFIAKVIASSTGWASDTFPILETVERCSKLEDRNRSDEPDLLTKTQLPLLKIYPNPAKNYAMVEYKINTRENAEWTLKVVSTIGTQPKEITIQESSGSISLELSDYTTGVYTLLLCQNGLIKATQRLIIQN